MIKQWKILPQTTWKRRWNCTGNITARLLSASEAAPVWTVPKQSMQEWQNHGSLYPTFITATTGMDALTHAVEAFIGNSTTPGTRKNALDSVRMIFENLDTAVFNGTDLDARRNMLRASFFAGCAFTKSYVGYVHAVAHSLGGEYNVPHGFANAVLLPFVLEAYGPAVHKKLKRLAIEVGLAQKDTPAEEASRAFIQAIKDMKTRYGIGDTIPSIREEDIPKLSHYADKEANPLYPVPVLMDAHQLETFYYMLMKKKEA